MNLSLAAEQITRNRQGLAKIFLWSFVISLVITPTFIYIFSLWQGRLADERITLLGFGIWWTISVILFLCFYFWRRFKPTELKIPKYKKHKIFYWALGVFVVAVGIHFLLYRYIPEFDSYSYIKSISQLIKHGEFLQREFRFLFFAFSWTLLFLSKTPLYWIFKILLPLCFSFLLIVFYQISRSLLQDKFYQLFATLSFLYFPIFFLEMFISRPQSIFMISLPIVLYLAVNLLRNKEKNGIFCWLLLLAVSILGFMMHESFIFLFAFVLIGLIFYLWPQIKKFPARTVLIVFLVLLGAYPWLRDSGFLDQLVKLISPFLKIFKHPQFDLWFLDGYINIDGNYVSWPGWSWFQYYGYNLGFVLPIFLVIIPIKKIKINWNFKNNWLYLVSFFTFFLVAEVFPRIGLAFLPDRAWLFASLSLAFLIPLFLKGVSKAFPKKILYWGLSLLLLASLCISWSITYIKQGMTTYQEFQAAQFIKENLPVDAAIITQRANGPMINYFANRLIVKPSDKFFMQNDLNSDLEFLRQLPEYISHKKAYSSQKKSLEQRLRNHLEEVFSVTPNSQDKMRELLNTYKKYQKIEKKLKIVEKEQLDKERPIYIVYSFDKFKSIYKIRKWWMDMSFYGADLSKFENPRYFEKVFDNEAVKIWRYKPLDFRSR